MCHVFIIKPTKAQNYHKLQTEKRKQSTRDTVQTQQNAYKALNIGCNKN